jgi:hypothetical protein
MDKTKGNSYKLLLIMAVVHFLAMYVLMYAMVNNFSNVFSNLNQVYMAGLMTSSMILLELIFMRKMYINKKLNVLLAVTGIIVILLFFFFVREQTALSDEQFLKSMIPHHAGAILMCEKASITNPDIKELCKNITASQQSEIEQMKSILENEYNVSG